MSHKFAIFGSGLGRSDPECTDALANASLKDYALHLVGVHWHCRCDRDV